MSREIPPRPFYPARVAPLWQDFCDAAVNAGLTDPAASLGERDRRLLETIFGNSPYLTRLALLQPAFTLALLADGPDLALLTVSAELARRVPEMTDASALKSALRIAKQKVALAVALADIAGLWPLSRITAALSDFAELAVDLAVAHLLRHAMQKGELTPPAGCADVMTLRAEPEIAKGCGYFVLGMGKLGARELNYSSDIDLIVLYDNEVASYIGPKSPQDCFIRITRDLVQIMQERTGDGYVFRTDLRLRPDPGATPVALSVAAAEIYYQSVGLNWERAAMIKARPIAGDRAAGAAFLDMLTGFVWRKHLDYAAMADIHAIKNLIHQHHRHGAIVVKGQDVKLGRGGIREIEFFAQIQQLIAGGREQALRVRDTMTALAVLQNTGRISAEEQAALIAAYELFRTVEHRLQMINDDQTHALPTSEEGLEHIAAFLGYQDAAALTAELLPAFNRVHTLYQELLEPTGERETAPPETRAFSPAAPDAAARLAALGFKDAERMRSVIEGWLFGRYRALRTPRARALLERLLPYLLDALSNTGEADGALMKFDDFLSKLPSGVQLLSLFQANPWLLELVVEIMGIAPALAAELSHRPVLLDAVLSPDFFNPLPATDLLRQSLAEALARGRDFQDVLDLARVWANEQRFRIGVQLLRATIDGSAAGAAMTRVAEATLHELLARVEADFAIRHGRIPGGRLSVIGMGKLGGGELTFTSDLDMIFVYDAPADAASDGPRSLSPSHYYARLSQTFINALTALTAEGRLFEVDMRLRPSGSAGPVAVSLVAFDTYQHASAWTWEHMALTRARPIVGDATLNERIAAIIRDVLTKPRDETQLLRDVADMRQRLRKEFGADNMWSVKHCPGGLVDAEFVCQYLELRHATTAPQVLSPHTADAIERLTAAGFLRPHIGAQLAEDYKLLHQAQSVVRLCVGGVFDEETAASGLKAALAKVIAGASFEEVRDRVAAAQARIAALHRDIIDEPAAVTVS